MALTKNEAQFIRTSAELLAEELLATEEIKDVVICEYDNDYARAHKANKYAAFALSLIVPPLMMIATLYFFLNIFDVDLGIVLSVFFIVIVAVPIVLAVRLFPFITSSGAVWLIVDDGSSQKLLIRYMPYDTLNRYKEVLFDRCAERYDDRWIIYCALPRGDRKKLTIPRAYPKLDEFLESYEQKR